MLKSECPGNRIWREGNQGWANCIDSRIYLWLPRLLIVTALVALGLVLSACSTTRDGEQPSPYIGVAVETAIGTLMALTATGDLPAEGVEFVDVTLDYGGTACKILADPTLDPAAKRIALMTELAEPRAAFDRAWIGLLASDIDRNTLLIVTPLMTGTRSAVRVALTQDIDPTRYQGACESVAALAASWAIQRGAVPVPAARGA